MEHHRTSGLDEETDNMAEEFVKESTPSPDTNDTKTPIDNLSSVGNTPTDQINMQLERFVHSFEKSARRWEIVVYPALFAFVVLAGYGFFLIYSLSSNMSKIAHSLDPSMGPHMQSMSYNMSRMADKVSSMSDTMGSISYKLDTLEPMLSNLDTMEKSMSHMNNSVVKLEKSVHGMMLSTGYMQQDMGALNQSVSRPMGFFNNFMPW